MKPLTHDELEALKAMAAAAMKGEVSGGEALTAYRETVPRLIAELERARELLQECADALTHSWEKEGLEELLAQLDKLRLSDATGAHTPNPPGSRVTPTQEENQEAPPR